MNGRELASLSGQEAIVVIRRPFVHWLGNIGRALLFDQLLFEGNARGGDWFAVTDSEWQNRLLVSRREIRDARDHLTGLGVLESKSEGMPRRMWYKLDADKAALLFTAFVETRGASTLEWPNGRSRLAKRPVKNGRLAAHSIQGVEGIREGTEPAAHDAAPANVTRRETPPTSDQLQAKPKAARKPRAPREPDPLNPLAEQVMLDTTGRRVLPDKRHAALIWPLVGDIRALTENNSGTAVLVWDAFVDSQPRNDDGGLKYVRPHTARDDFGRWAANGGAPKIAELVALVEAQGGAA